MKIVFINTIPIWGGGEHWTLQAALELRRRGHDVTILAAEGGRLLEKSIQEDIRTLPVPPSWWNERKVTKTIQQQLTMDPPDLLVANSGRDVRLANRIRPSEGRTQLIFRRGLDKPISNHPFHRRSFQQVRMILVNSMATRDTVYQSFPWYPKEDIEVIYNPIPLEEFLSYPKKDVRSELGIAPGAFVIGIVARLTRQKGHETLFRAMESIIPRVPSARVLVVGDGELRQELVSLVEALRIKDSVHFVGHARIVQPYYEASDVIAIPSLYEGFCLAAVEAQLMGRPVVASNSSSLPEVIQDNRTGFLVPVGDPAALAEKIVALSADPELRRRMGVEGRMTTESRFGARKIYDELEWLLRNLVSGTATC